MSGTAPTFDERLHWMDLLRGAAVLLIIAHHAATYPAELGLEVPDIIVTMNIALTPFRVPTLLVLSGMLLPRSLDKPLRRYYSGKARNILWPYLVWTVITALALDAAALENAGTWFWGYRHLWFLSTLLACYAVAPLLRRIPGWVIALSLFGVCFIDVPAVLPGVRAWIWFGAYFFLGTSISRLRIARWPWWIAAALGAIAGAGIVLAVTGPSTGYLLKPHWIVISLAGVGAILWLGPRIPRSRLTRMLESAGRQSICYYVAHGPAVYLACAALAAFGFTGGWLGYVVVLGVGIAVPFALTRIPGAHWLFTFGRRRSTRRDPDPETAGSLTA